MMAFTSDQWVILALIFVLGMLLGMFLTAGGRRKWKSRHRDEVRRREEVERDLRDREREWESHRAVEARHHDSDDRPL